MQTLKGARVKKSDLNHQWLEDILYFEGPILSLLKGSTTQDYFYYWCDADIICNRWMVLPVNRSDIINYKEGNLSLYDLCNCLDQVCFVDIDSRSEPKRGKLVSKADIPEDYIPPTESYFDEDLSPSAQFLPIPELYDLKLDGDWYLEELVGLPRIYSQLYSFIYTVKNIAKESVESNAEKIFSNYPWRGGFSTVNFFNDLSKVIPSFHEPKVDSIQYASPGQIRLELLRPVSYSLETVINASFENREELQKHYNKVATYIRDNELSQVEGNNSKLKLDNDIDNVLFESIVRFVTLMSLKPYQDDIIRLAGNNLVAIKIIMSIFRRNKKLFDFMGRGMLKFEG